MGRLLSASRASRSALYKDRLNGLLFALAVSFVPSNAWTAAFAISLWGSPTVHPLLDGDVLERFDELEKEGIDDIRDDEPERTTEARTESSRVGVGN